MNLYFIISHYLLLFIVDSFPSMDKAKALKMNNHDFLTELVNVFPAIKDDILDEDKGQIRSL